MRLPISFLRLSLLSALVFIISFSVQSQSNIPVNLPGQIAFVGLDYNIYTLTFQDDEPLAITEDGNPLRRRYEWPTWSFDGQLAYFCCNGQTSIEVFTSEDGLTPGQTIYDSMGEVFTYSYWSPSACVGTEVCYDLAVLISNLTTAQFDVRLLNTNDQSTTVIDSGAPFYFSWSPDGQQILTYRNETTIGIYQSISELFTPIGLNPGIFPAPAWSPVDERLLVGVDNGQSTDIVVINNGEIQTLVEGLNGQVTFNWSPDGNYVAYSTVAQNQFDLLYVVDSTTGEIVSQTAFDDTFAFFWSPDSSKLAYLTSGVSRGAFSAKQETGGVAWGILDIETNETWRYSNFFPTREMVYLISFFNQFAQSHQIWSPDSTHIVFGEQIANEQAVINILDITRYNSAPLSLGEGYIGIWSYN